MEPCNFLLFSHAFLAEREKRARFVYERARKRLVSRLRV